MARVVLVHLAEVDLERFDARRQDRVLRDGEQALEIRPVGERREVRREEVFQAERRPEVRGLAEAFETGEGAVLQDGAAEFSWKEVHCDAGP